MRPRPICQDESRDVFTEISTVQPKFLQIAICSEMLRHNIGELNIVDMHGEAAFN